MKQKTNKAASKRFKVSATGKITRRKARQAHFNARATGSETRDKRGDTGVSASDKGRVVRLLPYIS